MYLRRRLAAERHENEPTACLSLPKGRKPWVAQGGRAPEGRKSSYDMTAQIFASRQTFGQRYDTIDSMLKLKPTFRLIRSLTPLLCTLSLSARQFDFALPYQAKPQTEPAASQLLIETTSLPGTYPRATYSQRLQVRGGTAPYRWLVQNGDLPPGLILDQDGTLHGSPERTGEYRFTISVTDNSRPPQAVQREYALIVVAALSMKWKTPPHVTVNRLDGSVEVSNTTPDDFDLTFIVLAVNENNRATAIGYQRFTLKRGATDFELPFGDTLPHGAYVVHADAVGEIPEKNQIHRTRLQTPAPLQVTVGP
jgi:Putative Ig domain